MHSKVNNHYYYPYYALELGYSKQEEAKNKALPKDSEPH